MSDQNTLKTQEEHFLAQYCTFKSKGEDTEERVWSMLQFAYIPLIEPGFVGKEMSQTYYSPETDSEDYWHLNRLQRAGFA